MKVLEKLKEEISLDAYICNYDGKGDMRLCIDVTDGEMNCSSVSLSKDEVKGLITQLNLVLSKLETLYK